MKTSCLSTCLQRGLVEKSACLSCAVVRKGGKPYAWPLMFGSDELPTPDSPSFFPGFTSLAHHCRYLHTSIMMAFKKSASVTVFSTINQSIWHLNHRSKQLTLELILTLVCILKHNSIIYIE